MRIVVQRVFEGWVKVAGQTISHIGQGIVVYVGLTPGDSKDVVEHMVSKTLNMRLWQKDGKAWSASVMDINGQILAVSQFTLYGYLKGNKPDFHQAMQADQARELFELYVEMLRKKYVGERVKTGQFQTLMEVGSVVNGPVTIQHEKMAEEKGGGKKGEVAREKKEEMKKKKEEGNKKKEVTKEQVKNAEEKKEETKVQQIGQHKE